MPLTGPELPPSSGKAPSALIIFLHGLGSNGDDLMGLAPEMRDYFPYAQFLSPNAPFSCDMAPFGYQWFSLLDRRDAAVLAGVEQAHPILDHYITEQLSRFGLTEEKLALVGFSQGTMMALYTAVRRKKAIAGVVGYSGALISKGNLEKDAKSLPDICLIHGDADDIVPFENMALAELALSDAGFSVETHRRPHLAHGIDPLGLQAGVDFLRARLS
jgi:phospholipase/carboxylesterase